MGNYLDKTYAAVDGVLLHYEGKDISLKIPGRFADMCIDTIGDGAFMESADLQQVIIPDGVKKIGVRSFYGCDQLMSVYIPFSVASFAVDSFGGCSKLADLYVYGIDLTEQSYKNLIASSRRVNGSLYLAQSFPQFKILKDAASSTGAGPANSVQSGITRLFTSQSLEEETGETSITRNLYSFGFGSEERYMTETNEFMRLIADKNAFETDAVSEQKNDEFVKSGNTPAIEKTAVFTFDDSKTKFENGTYRITAQIKIGYHFWQSKVPVVLSGDTYYIYRRHYLSSKPNLNYIRRDVAVFDENGPVVIRKKAQEVYAKYKLLSIL